MRLIDADALREKHCEGCSDDVRESCKTDPVCASLMWVVEEPTIDAVEVVRCKDCVHWLNEDGLEDHVCLKIYSDAGVHSVAWLNRKPDDFCSDGKRRSHHDSLCDQEEG